MSRYEEMIQQLEELVKSSTITQYIISRTSFYKFKEVRLLIYNTMNSAKPLSVDSSIRDTFEEAEEALGSSIIEQEVCFKIREVK